MRYWSEFLPGVQRNLQSILQAARSPGTTRTRGSRTWCCGGVRGRRGRPAPASQAPAPPEPQRQSRSTRQDRRAMLRKPRSAALMSAVVPWSRGPPSQPASAALLALCEPGRNSACQICSCRHQLNSPELHTRLFQSFPVIAASTRTCWYICNRAAPGGTLAVMEA